MVGVDAMCFNCVVGLIARCVCLCVWSDCLLLCLFVALSICPFVCCLIAFDSLCFTCLFGDLLVLLVCVFGLFACVSVCFFVCLPVCLLFDCF